MKVFCIGFGYTAHALATQLQADPTVVVVGTRRTAVPPSIVAFDGATASPATLALLDGASHVLVSVPPEPSGCPAHHAFAAALSTSSSVQWIGYLSTVGVYGDTGGAWVDEASPVRAQSERAHRRVAAETAWRAFAERTGRYVDIFRLPGIYGPGRSALDQLRTGTAKRIIKPGQVFNRIHVDDIAGALVTAMTSSGRNAELVRVFNITDDEPAPPQDVIAYAATLLGMSTPPETPFEQANLSPMAASFYAENKRVSNARMKRDLGYTLRYPTYREGLASC